MTPDPELLRRFAEAGSEAAFAELVQRHVNLVYSAALRQVNGDAHLAQDVAQTVFTDLARKAGSLARRETLSGWLYTSAHFAAAKIIRGETRRRDREEKFMREPTNDSGMGVPPVQSAPETDWEKLRPTLDDAMHELKQADRDAILLRYFENRQFAEVGAQLGLNENAARMRVERALEKLRGVFAKRGISTATALASVISCNAVQIAPANLAATLTAASIANAGTLTLSKIMTFARLKFAFSALVIAAVATAFILQHQAQERLRAENETLTEQLAQIQTDKESLSNRLAAIGNSKPRSDEQFNELLRLRGEVTRLRQQPTKQPIILPATPKSETNAVRAARIQIHLKARFVALPTDELQSLGVEWISDVKGVKTGLLTEPRFKIIREALLGASDVERIGEPELTTVNGIQAEVSITRPVPVGGTNADVGASLGVTSYFLTNSSTFDLNLNAKLSQLTGDSSQPGLQTIQVTNHVTLSPSQTVVLTTKIPNGGWLPDSTNIPAAPRSFLVFVTPTPVDEAGNRLNFPPQNQ
jgi:RNA polymerase sigma factor (sigma-70 family)